MKFDEKTELQLIELQSERGVSLEGNILKVVKPTTDAFAEYVKKAKEQDRSTRKKRLEITKQIQAQNKELATKAAEKEQLMEDLKLALDAAEGAKAEALNDLELMHKKTQFELIGKIVQVALWIIIGVGVLTTVLFLFAMLTGRDTTLLGNTWSNLFGILLTNSFSIIGTIMGVKYASENQKTDKGP